MRTFQTWLKVSGLASVIAVNLFVFGSDFLAKYFNHIPSFEHAFLHFTEDHQINQSPFTISIVLKADAFSMKSMPDIPAPPTQFFTGLFAALISLLIAAFSRFDLLRGEEKETTQFALSRIFPPPKRF